MEPLDPELRELIDEGMPAALPSEDTQQRGLQAFLSHVEAPPTPAAPLGPATTGLAKWVVAAVVGTTGAVGWVVTRPEPAPQVRTTEPEAPAAVPIAPPPAPAPAVQAPAPAPAPAVQAPAPAPALARRTPKKPVAPPTAAPPSAGDALRAEADLIARAESALDRGKPREALALCDFHVKGFTDPQLVTERRAIAASAACMVDATDTQAALTFVDRHPQSPLAKKVQQRCKLPPR